MNPNIKRLSAALERLAATINIAISKGKSFSLGNYETNDYTTTKAFANLTSLSNLLKTPTKLVIDLDEEKELEDLIEQIDHERHQIDLETDNNQLIALDTIYNLITLTTEKINLLKTKEEILKISQKDLNELILLTNFIKQNLPKQDNLKQHLENISILVNQAKEFNIDIKILAEAREEIRKIQKESIEDLKSTKDNMEDIEKKCYQVASFYETTKSYAEKSQEAYRITTTTGLAAAFAEKAKRLEISINIWLATLIISLAAGILIGWFRYDSLVQVISDPNLTISKSIMHMMLSIISIGAPIWLAWLSTRQIGQRFQLAEDYSYKATLGKVYEGYKKEAANFDHQVSFKLFESALKHLDEPPLRLVDHAVHGSPLHDLLDTSATKEFVKAFNSCLKSYKKNPSPHLKKSSTNPTSNNSPTA